ncbi:nucleoside 2-deoxyribosyltransferase [Variovorax sp. PAMC26660]|uniref:nucleoside 2-deoxyribosyltransferase n=1 Tax=Variovorax sp. PAMC26660 TaxID=2762322 RepID=UPI00164CFB56|nr:nucleoside 2-deoxyribosyltransferase [Variovorax sp. PAMC26660]QNK66821.1 nucleoside 2-deoxyribosyltransferase [Variovorax sp. PAMC26660]
MPIARPRVYLAGPDVFRPDAVQHFAALVRACNALGMEALVPSDDGAAAAGLNGLALARAIYNVNMGLLSEADGVIANVAPFRGAEPDSGTVFEVGVAVALGLPVVAYGVPPSSYASRVQSVRDTQGVLRDASGAAIEDFGLSMNLMLSCSTHTAPTATEAIKVMATLLR